MKKFKVEFKLDRESLLGIGGLDVSMVVYAEDRASVSKQYDWVWDDFRNLSHHMIIEIPEYNE